MAGRKDSVAAPIPAVSPSPEPAGPAPGGPRPRTGPLGPAVPVPSPTTAARSLRLRREGAKPVILLVAGNHCRVGRADPRESLAPELDLAPLEAGRPRPSVSRRHAEIARLPEGWQVTDLGSANGTELDGRRLRPGRPEPLSPGSRVCFGALCFVVEEEP